MNRITTAIYQAAKALGHAAHLARYTRNVSGFLREGGRSSCADLARHALDTVPVVERLEALLGEWLYEGRFWAANCEEAVDLCKRTYDILTEIDSEYRERRLW